MNQIPELDQKGLRRFALTTGAALAFIFGMFLPWLFDRWLPLALRIDDDLREILATHRPEPVPDPIRQQICAILGKFETA